MFSSVWKIGYCCPFFVQVTKRQCWVGAVSAALLRGAGGTALSDCICFPWIIADIPPSTHPSKHLGVINCYARANGVMLREWSSHSRWILIPDVWEDQAHAKSSLLIWVASSSKTSSQTRTGCIKLWYSKWSACHTDISAPCQKGLDFIISLKKSDLWVSPWNKFV